MKAQWISALVGSFLFLSAQAPELTLAVQKTMGLNNGSQIQGSFRMEASGPADLTAVTFKVDDTVLATVTAAPFRAKFNTEAYAPGWHTLSATGITAGGVTLASPAKKFQFLTSAEAWRVTQGIIIPVFGAIGLAMLIGVGIQFAPALWGKKRSLPLGVPRDYGLLGGTVCPQCGWPFPLHWWSVRVVVGRLERCERCGKWSVVRRASPSALAAAEAAAAGPAPAAAEPPPAEKLKRQLDDSRFTDER
jgi:hypothetical protein